MYGYSWRAWIGQHAYPAVPFFGFLPYLDGIPAALLFGCMLLCLVFCLAGAGSPRWLWGYVAASALLILQDQNRFQPWAYHFLLCSLALRGASGRESAGLLRLLTAGIYLYSGLQKLDRHFIDHTGSYLLQPFLRPFGMRPEYLPGALRAFLALGMGSLETLLAPGLLWRRARPFAVAGGILMHLGILFSLGPWGLRYNAIVWPWNLFMIACLAILFTPLLHRGRPEGGPAAGRFCRASFFLALTFPLLKFVDAADVYPSFGLYSDQIEDSRIFIRWESAFKLPPDIRQHLDKPAADKQRRVWAWLKASEWSLAELGIPGYPQHRFYAGVAWGLCSRFELEDDLVLEQHGIPGRLSGKSAVVSRAGCQEVCRDARGYWFNARPANPPFNRSAPEAPISLCQDESAWSRDIQAGLLAHGQGLDEEAEKRFQSSLREALSSEAAGMRAARSLDLLAGLALRRKRYAEAESLYRRSAQAWKRERGARHPGTAARLMALASALVYQRRYVEAAAAYREALAGFEEAAGPASPPAALALNALAEAALAQGRRAEARALYSRALEIHRGTFPDHPDAAFDLSRLAAIAAAEGRRAEARRLESWARTIRAKYAGEVTSR